MRNDFAIFILTHGRPNNQITLNTILKSGYTGKYYIIVDDEDSKLEEYIDLFGDRVVVFNKKEVAKNVDSFDLENDRKVILYARNACFEIAKRLGIKYFLEFDDDYSALYYIGLENYRLKKTPIKQLDRVCEEFITFLENSGAKTVCMAQTGDFICGTSNPVFRKKLSRKSMNSFFCSVDRPFNFVGRMNEDVNTYVSRGARGELFFTVAYAALNQMQTQKNQGGMTDDYKKYGTYVKSFYTVMCAPSCTKLWMMGAKNERIHHKITWRNAVPLILNQKWKKE